jgi:hypothetical protein
MLVWGRVKSGKTTFAASGPNPIMFLAEAGQMSVRTVKDLMVYPLNPDGSFKTVRWKDAYDFLYFLRYGDHNRKTVSVDTMSALVRIGMRYILKDEEARDDAREPGVADQRTWGRLATLITEFMEELETICKTRGYHLIYTAQEKVLNEEKAMQEGVDVIPDFSPSIRSFITQKPDILARTLIEEEVSDDLEAEPVLNYGMLFRDSVLAVGERITPARAKSLWIPRKAFNVTVPKLVNRIEQSRKKEQ